VPNRIVGSLLILELQLDVLLRIVGMPYRTTGRSALTKAFIAIIAPNSLPLSASQPVSPGF
jgi:hypothetical protein